MGRRRNNKGSVQHHNQDNAARGSSLPQVVRYTNTGLKLVRFLSRSSYFEYCPFRVSVLFPGNASL